ncbi:hypothetical protein TcCL_ESM05909 [Trypanosoma cruzi]|nr:hypothetical protein TcCL_ESM05909 [Trypanosoma cruzi]
MPNRSMLLFPLLLYHLLAHTLTPSQTTGSDTANPNRRLYHARRHRPRSYHLRVFSAKTLAVVRRASFVAYLKKSQFHEIHKFPRGYPPRKLPVKRRNQLQ